MFPEPSDIIKHFPIAAPYKFIDEILELDSDHVVGTYTFKPDEFFFKGHFPGNPVVPGSILLEAAAQIGLIPLGIYTLVAAGEFPEWENRNEGQQLPMADLFYLVSSDLVFKKVIKPGEQIIVRSEKVFYKLQKLKCNVSIKTEDGALVCRGIMAGVVNINNLIL